MTVIHADFGISNPVGLEELGFVQNGEHGRWKHSKLPLIAKAKTETCFVNKKNWATHEIGETVITGDETVVHVFCHSKEGNKEILWWWTHEHVIHSENCHTEEKLSLLKPLLSDINDKIVKVKLLAGSKKAVDSMVEFLSELKENKKIITDCSVDTNFRVVVSWK